MGAIRTLGAVTVVAGTPTPILLPILNVIAAASFSIKNGIASITLSTALPTNGYNGPNGFPVYNATTGSKLDIHGGVRGSNNTGSPNFGGGGPGQQVMLWGFTTATYFNGKTVTVLDNDGNKTFRFYFNHANVSVTSDAGSTAPAPFEQYRSVYLEVGAGNGTDFVYVGDGNVSSSQYLTALNSSNPSKDIAGDAIHADRIWIDGTSNSDTVQVSLIY